MNREIKFRVYSDELDEMIYPDKESKYIFNIWGDGTPNIYEGYRELYDFDAVVMQFTGLQDKNGVPIYEGDIVKEDLKLYQIIFKHGCFGIYKKEKLSFHSEETYEKFISIYNYFGNEVDCIVIGNIYENQELLKQKDGN